MIGLSLRSSRWHTLNSFLLPHPLWKDLQREVGLNGTTWSVGLRLGLTPKELPWLTAGQDMGLQWASPLDHTGSHLLMDPTNFPLSQHRYLWTSHLNPVKRDASHGSEEDIHTPHPIIRLTNVSLAQPRSRPGSQVKSFRSLSATADSFLQAGDIMARSAETINHELTVISITGCAWFKFCSATKLINAHFKWRTGIQ